MTVWWGVSWSTSGTQYNAMWNSMMQYQQDNTIRFEVFTVQCNTKPITIWYENKYHMGSNLHIAWPLTSSWKVPQKGENDCLGVALAGLWTPNGPHSWKDPEMCQTNDVLGIHFWVNFWSIFHRMFRTNSRTQLWQSMGALWAAWARAAHILRPKTAPKSSQLEGSLTWQKLNSRLDEKPDETL